MAREQSCHINRWLDWLTRGRRRPRDQGPRSKATPVSVRCRGLRETDLFTDAERAALALAESMTRLADRPDPVPDKVWDEAAKHFDDKQMAGLVLWVATTNLFNRLNATTKQSAGAAW